VLYKVMMKENILYLFCDCVIIEKFWNDVSDWIAAKYRINFRLNKFHNKMIQYFNMINIIRKTEYIIAKERNKLNLHYKKWRALI